VLSPSRQEAVVTVDQYRILGQAHRVNRYFGNGQTEGIQHQKRETETTANLPAGGKAWPAAVLANAHPKTPPAPMAKTSDDFLLQPVLQIL